jgi:hypothetical protein
MGNNMILCNTDDRDCSIQNWLDERAIFLESMKEQGIVVPDSLKLKNEELWIIDHMHKFQFPKLPSDCSFMKKIRQKVNRTNRILNSCSDMDI